MNPTPCNDCSELVDAYAALIAEVLVALAELPAKTTRTAATDAMLDTLERLGVEWVAA